MVGVRGLALALVVVAVGAIAGVPAAGSGASEGSLVWRLEKTTFERQWRDGSGKLPGGKWSTGAGPVVGCPVNACTGEIGDGQFSVNYKTETNDQGFFISWTVPPKVLFPGTKKTLTSWGEVTSSVGSQPFRVTFCFEDGRAPTKAGLGAGFRKDTCTEVANNVASVEPPPGKGVPVTFSPPPPKGAADTLEIVANVSGWGRVTYAYRAGKPVGGATRTKSRVLPPGGKASTSFPVDAKSTQATVTLSGASLDDVLASGLAAVEKARRVEKLKQTKEKLETNCYLTVGHVKARGGLVESYDYADRSGLRLGLACAALLEEVQKRIDELEKQEPGAGPKACKVIRLQLQSEKTNGKWATEVVKTGVKPRLGATCKATGEGLELRLRRKGGGTLRDAVGEKLSLTVRRSKSASGRAKLAVSVTQR